MVSETLIAYVCGALYQFGVELSLLVNKAKNGSMKDGEFQRW